MTNFNKAMQAMSGLAKADARAVYASVVRRNKNAVTGWLASRGYVVVDEASATVAPDGAEYLSDGRLVFYLAGARWALSQEAHAKKIAAALEHARAARAAETKSVAGTESLSAMTCPKCGDALQHTAVCPKCAAGKLGYRHRYTCVCGGVDLVSKDKL